MNKKTSKPSYVPLLHPITSIHRFVVHLWSQPDRARSLNQWNEECELNPALNQTPSIPSSPQNDFPGAHAIPDRAN